MSPSVAQQQSQTGKITGNSSAKSTLLLATIVFGASALVFFTNLGNTPLFNSDEAYYAEPAREMLENGDYIVTYLNYAVRHTKPPLVIWIMSFCYQMFGVNEFASRFLGAACGCILITITALFTRTYISMRAAIVSAAILVTSPLFIGVGREAITDMPLSLFIAGALMSFFHGFTSNTQRWKWVGYALVGLAIMTKGPVGLVLPVVIMSAYHLLRGDVKKALNYYQPLQGLLLTLTIGLPWFVIVIAKTNGDYFREFILRENFQRFTSVVDHKAPWFYHIIAMFGGLLPWSLFLPAAVWSLVKTDAAGTTQKAITATTPPSGLAQRAISKIQSTLAQFKAGDAYKSVLLLSICTAIITLTFFSASVSKLIPYTVPAFPAAAILIAAYLDRTINNKSVKPFAIFFAVLSVIYGIGLVVAPSLVLKIRDCPPQLPQLINGALWTLFGASLVALATTLKRHFKVAVTTFASVLFLTIGFFGLQALEELGDYWELPIQSYAQFAGATDWPIVVFEIRKPSVTFYAHRRVTVTDDQEILKRKLASSKNAFVITRTKRAELLDKLGCKRVSTMGKTTLARWTNPQL